MRTRTNNDDSATADGYRVALFLREINAALTERIAASVAGTGLTLPQIVAVKALAHRGELTVTELARELAVGKSTAVGIVDRLERAGLVARRRGGEDRREVKVGFAAGAEPELRRIKAAVDECFATAFAGLGAERLRHLESSLQSVLDTLGPAGGAGPESD